MAFNDDVIKRIGSGGHDIKKMMTSEVIGYRHLNIRKNLYSKSKLKWTVDVIEIVNKKKSLQKRHWEQIPAPASHPSSVWVEEEKPAKDACIMCIFHTYRDNVCKSVYRSSMEVHLHSQTI